MVDECLREFGINFDSDIVASTQDGASIMVCYSNIIKCESQLCLNHAIHLAVTKVFYEKKNKASIQHDLDETYSETSSEDDSENEAGFHDDFSYVLEESIKQTIKKARKIVIFFKQSSVRNGILQKFVKEYRGSKIELKVKKDVDTRWNSILSMCKRLVEIEQPIKMALSELGDNKYDENLFTKLKEIVSCLSPLEEAILEIGKSDSNLLKADSAIQYILTTLGKSEHEWSKELLSNLKIELQNRRNTDLVSLYKCLHTKSFDFLNNSSHELGYSSKKDIIFTAKRLYYQLFEYSNNSESVNDELGSAFLSPTEAEEKSSQCQSKSLSDFVQKEMSSSEQSSSQSNIKDEFKSMIATKVLTPKLELLYNALSTIQPSSTSCEEAFSVASLFATKLRNRSGPILLNALVFLKYYFLKKDGKQLKNRKQS